mmetsp:Transcript_33715/g.95385  ORF Transcript_33715/g.95385 Transcript_33715/m.95385 type:complete len:639 (+) Transcript_33715:261-2177(+)
MRVYIAFIAIWWASTSMTSTAEAMHGKQKYAGGRPWTHLERMPSIPEIGNDPSPPLRGMRLGDILRKPRDPHPKHIIKPWQSAAPLQHGQGAKGSRSTAAGNRHQHLRVRGHSAIPAEPAGVIEDPDAPTMPFVNVSDLVKSLAEDQSVKKMFRDAVSQYRQRLRQQQKEQELLAAKLAEEERNTTAFLRDRNFTEANSTFFSTSALGDNTTHPVNSSEDGEKEDEEPCDFPDRPQFCAPLTVREIPIEKPDVIETMVKVTGLRSTCEISSLPPTDLTAIGARTKVIVFVALGGGLVCEKSTHDWRARFPGHLGSLANATVISWMIRYNSCFTCHNANPGDPRTCAQHIEGGVDLLVILGSGRFHRSIPCSNSTTAALGHGSTMDQGNGGAFSEVMEGDQAAAGDSPLTGSALEGGHLLHSSFHFGNSFNAEDHEICDRRFPDLWDLMNLEWAKNATMTVHFPIRRIAEVQENSLFNFHRIIEDNGFSKPPDDCTAAVLGACRQVMKQKRLVYIARMHPGKGQLAFLETVNPKLMREYTLHVYGGAEHYGPNSTAAEYQKAVEAVARRRRIHVKLHGDVGKGSLYAGICAAMGLIHFAEDKNPRSVYEGVLAGLPAFINKEAKISKDLEDQPFVVVRA